MKLKLFLALTIVHYTKLLNDLVFIDGMLNYSGIIENVKTIGDNVDTYYKIIAAGGTALVLHHIKSETRDVDFIVEEGNPYSFKEYYEKYVDSYIDISPAGLCFKINMPTDYVSVCDYIGKFGNVDLFTLNKLDVIITKSSRYKERDKVDLEDCTNVDLDMLKTRIHDYPMHHSYSGNIEKAMREVFGIEI